MKSLSPTSSFFLKIHMIGSSSYKSNMISSPRSTFKTSLIPRRQKLINGANSTNSSYFSRNKIPRSAVIHFSMNQIQNVYFNLTMNDLKSLWRLDEKIGIILSNLKIHQNSKWPYGEILSWLEVKWTKTRGGKRVKESNKLPFHTSKPKSKLERHLFLVSRLVVIYSVSSHFWRN